MTTFLILCGLCWVSVIPVTLCGLKAMTQEAGLLWGSLMAALLIAGVIFLFLANGASQA